jgi:hypothetical protein
MIEARKPMHQVRNINVGPQPKTEEHGAQAELFKEHVRPRLVAGALGCDTSTTGGSTSL